MFRICYLYLSLCLSICSAWPGVQEDERTARADLLLAHEVRREAEAGALGQPHALRRQHKGNSWM